MPTELLQQQNSMFSPESILRLQVNTTLTCIIPLALLLTFLIKAFALNQFLKVRTIKSIGIDLITSVLIMVGFLIVTGVLNIPYAIVFYPIISVVIYVLIEYMTLKKQVQSKPKLIIVSLISSIIVVAIPLYFAYSAYIAGPL